jgi:hypothetical protein
MASSMHRLFKMLQQKLLHWHYLLVGEDDHHRLQKGLSTNQPSIHGWFKVIDKEGESQSSSGTIGQTDSILALLCWGF